VLKRVTAPIPIQSSYGDILFATSSSVTDLKVSHHKPIITRRSSIIKCCLKQAPAVSRMGLSSYCFC